MEKRISICNRTPEGRLMEEAVCFIKDGEARWVTKTPNTAPLISLAYKALEIIPTIDPFVVVQEKNN